MLDLVKERARRVATRVQEEVSGATLSLFDHARYPLTETLRYRGDPGLLGPDSISWQVLADPAAIVGGLRGLLIQAAHPEVVAGVGDHSRYRDDPFGRLSRTSAYVTATTFGASPEVENAVLQVRRAHRVVNGTSSRGISYSAEDPGFSAWVHNALTDSFLATNQAYAEERLDDAQADRFVEEQTRIGALLGADPMPPSALQLRTWVTDDPDLAPSPEMEDVVDFLTDPPLPAGVKVGYRVVLEAALATIPPRILETLGLRPRPGALLAGKTAVAGLRWALGHSPSWALALTRCSREIPREKFKHLPDSLLEIAS